MKKVLIAAAFVTLTLPLYADNSHQKAESQTAVPTQEIPNDQRILIDCQPWPECASDTEEHLPIIKWFMRLEQTPKNKEDTRNFF
ncbi:hypothetical protein [Aliikangiella sp. IMCC44632]